MSNVGKRLDEWLLKQKAREFPVGGKVDYVKQFDAVTDYLKRHVHTEVEKGAAVHPDPPAKQPLPAPIDAEAYEAAQAPKAEDEAMFLNNHGPEHISAVIARASDILNSAQCTLTAYECYLFLFAAHLHDTGNLFGRQGHEQRCRDIIKQLGKLAGDDEFEKRQVLLIATAHGGKTATGDKDTISGLQPEVTLLGQKVRPQFLAALLRLADELADDRSRASRFALQAGAVPEASKIYHHYSQSLHSVTISEREIKLDFELNEDVARMQFEKNGQNTFLLDEIFARTLKMHLERMYCMRFLRPKIRLDEIRVSVEVYDSSYSKCLHLIPFGLYETGYPAGPNGGIHALCPLLADWSGETLKNKLDFQGGAQ